MKAKTALLSAIFLVGCSAETTSSEAEDVSDVVTSTHLREFSCRAEGAELSFRVSADGRVATGLRAQPRAKQLNLEKLDDVKASAKGDRLAIEAAHAGTSWSFSISRGVFTSDPKASFDASDGFECSLLGGKGSFWGAGAEKLYRALAVPATVTEQLSEGNKVVIDPTRSRVLCKAQEVLRPEDVGARHFCSIELPAFVTSAGDGMVRYAYDVPLPMGPALARAMAKSPSFTTPLTDANGVAIPKSSASIVCKADKCRLEVSAKDTFSL
jgi:hypothetical protein